MEKGPENGFLHQPDWIRIPKQIVLTSRGCGVIPTGKAIRILHRSRILTPKEILLYSIPSAPRFWTEDFLFLENLFKQLQNFYGKRSFCYE